MYTIYHIDNNGKKWFLDSCEDSFTAEVMADHIQCDHPRMNVVVIEE